MKKFKHLIVLCGFGTLYSMEPQRFEVVPSLKNIVAQAIVASFDNEDEKIIDITAKKLPLELFVYLNQAFMRVHSLSFFHYFVLLYPYRSSASVITKLSEYYPQEINRSDRIQETALHKAALWGFVNLVKILLEHKADVHARTMHGDTPLHFAALRGYSHELKGTIISGEYGYSRYDYAFFPEYPLPNPMTFTPNKQAKRGTKQDYADIITLLLEHGARASDKGRYGALAVHNAADHGFFKGMHILLNHYNESVHIKNDYQQTALHKVVRVGNAQSVQLLIDKGADCFCYDVVNQTPLDCAIRYQNYQAQKIIEKHLKQTIQK